MEINGVAHVMLTVGNYEACLPFYEKLLPFLGLTFVVRKTDSQFYCIGGRTGIGIHKAAEKYRGERFAQGRRIASRLPARARAQGRRRGLPVPARHRRHDHPSARGGSVGSGLLLGAVRGPRRHSARSQSHPGQGPARRASALAPSSIESSGVRAALWLRASVATADSCDSEALRPLNGRPSEPGAAPFNEQITPS